MSEAAVMPRGNAVAATAADVSGTAGRTDGRNRRAAETRRKVIEAAKAMIEALGGFVAGTTYFFRFRALTRSGAMEWSQVVSFLVK